MANSQAFCNQAKLDLLLGKHAFGTSVVRGTTDADSFKCALYEATATIDKTTTAYAAPGEVTGTNYPPGGVALGSGFTAPQVTADVAHTTPAVNIVFTNVTLSTSFDAALIYNDTQADAAFSVHTFAGQTVTAGDFTLTMPVNDNATGLIRIA